MTENDDFRLARIERKLDQIQILLLGDGIRAGLADDVRDLKVFKKTTIGAITLVVGTIVMQIAVWVRSKL
jgi:hypothetical protein